MHRTIQPLEVKDWSLSALVELRPAKAQTQLYTIDPKQKLVSYKY